MDLSDIVPTLAVLLLGGFFQSVLARRAEPWEVPLLWGSWAAHVFSTFALIWVVVAVYGIGDMIMYREVGAELARAMRADFLEVAPQVLRVLFQRSYRLSIFVPGDGSATGSMCALSGLVGFFLNDSLYAINLFFALVSYFGKVALYRAFERELGREHARLLLIGVLLVPSTVFWSAGLVKEGIAMAGTGPYVLGMLRVVRDRSSRGFLLMALGALMIALVKPYILMVLLGATGVAYYWQRSVARGIVEFRPLTLALGVAVAVAGVLIVGEISPRFSIERLAEETGRLQSAGHSIKARGGSTYAIGTGATSLTGQLLYAPLGLLTALYRPVVFEVTNPQMLASAVETTVFLVASLVVLARQSARDLWNTVVRYPILAFCLSFVLVLGIATGLTSSNLGTLSRYRMPVVPFFAASLVVFWSAAQRATVRSGPARIPTPPAWARPPAPPPGPARR